MKKSFNILPYFAFFIFVSVARAEDDDDNIIEEIITDLLVGAAIEVCSMYTTCSLIMVFFTFGTLIIIAIALCIGEIGCSDIFNCRNARRGATMGAGRAMVRGYR
tara:strand:+ start:812 stop:1126 length:315 start_codon:yes stop_codon:yes gene_type:complete